jgi:methionine synthase II (cobalamin-independent)
MCIWHARTWWGVREGQVSAAKLHAAEDRAVREATQYLPLERLAISPQCGFASGEAGNPLTPEQQEAKLRLVARVARRVWRT